MAWHVNPASGEPGNCDAQYNCPFGGEFSHLSTKTKAREMYAEYRDGLFDPKGTSEFYMVPDDLSERYTQGGCGVLARKIHEDTGYPIFAVETVDGEGYVCEHVVVQTPDGRFLDSTGVRPLENLISVWSRHWGGEPSDWRVTPIASTEVPQALGSTEETFANYDADGTARLSAIVLGALNERF